MITYLNISCCLYSNSSADNAKRHQMRRAIYCFMRANYFSLFCSPSVQRKFFEQSLSMHVRDKPDGCIAKIQGAASMMDSRKSSPGTASGNGTVTLPIHEEELRVGIKSVDTGKGIRAHKSVKETPTAIDEILLHDEVTVEHVPSNAIFTLDKAPVARYEGDVLVVPVLEEILVVEKRVRVKEELHISKNRREERHLETVLLKSEEVSVERFDESSGMQKN
jgi:uncharacterized protein (TIGR02271 family)